MFRFLRFFWPCFDNGGIIFNMSGKIELHPTPDEIEKFIQKFVTDEGLKLGAAQILNSWNMANQLGVSGLLIDQSRQDIDLLLKMESKKK